MRALAEWLISLAIDIFKLFVIFIVVFALAARMGFLYASNSLKGNRKMKNFIGSLIVAVLSVIGIIFVAGVLFVAPAFEALKNFHFG